MQKNPVCFWELASHDAGATVKFLKEVFDWEFDLDEELGIYELPAVEAPNGFRGGGVFTLRKAKLPFLTIYIEVDDVDARAKRVEELGGHIVEAPFDVTEKIRICLFNEPSGVTLGMVQRRVGK